MPDLDDVRRIVLAMPHTVADEGFSVWDGKKQSGFAWPWNERIEPKKPKVRNLKVLAVRTANLEEKALLIASNPEVYFTEDHYNGFPAVLVRLENIELAELEEILKDAWRTRASRRIQKESQDS